MKETKYEIINEEKTPQVILVGLRTDQTETHFERAMDELYDLSFSCGFEPVFTLTQNAPRPTQSTYIGSGKVEELKNIISEFGADIVIFDQTLTPMQFRNLNKELGVEVMDRTGLILRIFSDQARTKEAKLQVEYANLQYTLPRLAGMWTHLGRQSGSSGSRSSRGEGETQIELDRRYIERRMSELERELKSIQKKRVTQRERRMGREMPLVALVGYTNAGKSTIMNRLLTLNAIPDEQKQVLEENKLFATLDTTVRKITPKGHSPFLLTDTVGFIDELPHSLVKAFRSTLEEIVYADLLLMVVDISDPEYRECIRVTEETLREIGAGAIPLLHVYNKMDLAEENDTPVPTVKDNDIFISAGKGDGLEALLNLIEENLRKNYLPSTFLFPYDKGSAVNFFQNKYPDTLLEYREDGVWMNVICSREDAARYHAYLLTPVS